MPYSCKVCCRIFLKHWFKKKRILYSLYHQYECLFIVIIRGKTLKMVVCPFVLFLLTIVLSVLLWFTDSDYPFGIFKLFLITLLAMFLRTTNQKTLQICFLQLFLFLISIPDKKKKKSFKTEFIHKVLHRCE